MMGSYAINMLINYREQLNKCRSTISNLTSEENSLRESLQQERENQNMYVNML